MARTSRQSHLGPEGLKAMRKELGCNSGTETQWPMYIALSLIFACTVVSPAFSNLS